MKLEDVVSAQYRKNAVIVGFEIAWRGADILAVLDEFAKADIAVLGVESVRFPGPDRAPLVEAVSDCSPELAVWRTNESWKACVAHSLSRSISDIERNVANPYRDSVWYIVVKTPALEKRGLA